MTAAPRPAALGRPRQSGLAIPCPHCRAAAGQPCTIPANGRRLPAPHPSRTEQEAHA